MDNIIRLLQGLIDSYKPLILSMDRLVAFEQPYLTRNSERQLLMYLMDKKYVFLYSY